MTRDRCGGSTIWPGRGNYSLCSQKRGGEHKNEIDNELLFLSKTLWPEWFLPSDGGGPRPLLGLYDRNKRPVNRKASGRSFCLCGADGAAIGRSFSVWQRLASK